MLTWEGSAYVGGPNLLTWYGIYHLPLPFAKNWGSPFAQRKRDNQVDHTSENVAGRQQYIASVDL